MHSSGFEASPVTQTVIFTTAAASVLASIADAKYFFFIQLSPHIWSSHQYWRLLTWQTCYSNSTEVLFACWTLYNLRVIERIWGSRKLLSFIIVTLPYTLLLPPLLAAILRPLSFGRLNHIPGGPTPLVFALLAQYHAAIPFSYQYRIGGVSSSQPSAGQSITLSSKSTSYLLPAQLALSQFPAALIPAFVGWLVGYAYRYELIPGTRWRVPAWVVGQSTRKNTRQHIDGLRRRLEAETTGTATGSSVGVDGSRRRG